MTTTTPSPLCTCWTDRPDPDCPRHAPAAAAPASTALRVSGFTLAWIFWAAFFLVVEGWALIRKQHNDTFSEHWWSLFRVRSKVPLPVRVALAVLQMAFATWLTGHLVFGWWTL